MRVFKTSNYDEYYFAVPDDLSGFWFITSPHNLDRFKATMGINPEKYAVWHGKLGYRVSLKINAFDAARMSIKYWRNDEWRDTRSMLSAPIEILPEGVYLPPNGLGIEIGI